MACNIRSLALKVFHDNQISWFLKAEMAIGHKPIIYLNDIIVSEQL